MGVTTTELPGLLRGCVKWRDGRAWGAEAVTAPVTAVKQA